MIRLKKFSLVFLLLIMVIVVEAGYIQAEEFKTVVDMVGNKVDVPVKVEKIITTYAPATQFILALGVQDRLVAGSHGIKKQKVFPLLDANINDMPDVGQGKKGVNLETIMGFSPDLVIMFPSNNGPKSSKRLNDLGVPTIVIRPESFQEIIDTTTLLGDIIGVEEQAKKSNAQNKKILKLLERTKNIPENERKTVYFGNSTIMSTVGAGIMQTDLIELAGGINPVAMSNDGFVDANKEQLITWNPDVIILSQFYRGDPEKLKNASEYQSIKAIQNGEVYRIPSNIEPWDYPGPSSPLIAIWLGKRIYPDLFKDVDYEKVVNDFYLNVYGKTYTELGGQY